MPGRLTEAISQEFIDRFVAAKKSKAKRSRRAASDVARTLRVLANAPTANTPMPAASSGGSTASESMPATMLSTAPAKPKIEPQKLSIGTGYAGGG